MQNLYLCGRMVKHSATLIKPSNVPNASKTFSFSKKKKTESVEFKFHLVDIKFDEYILKQFLTLTDAIENI